MKKIFLICVLSFFLFLHGRTWANNSIDSTLLEKVQLYKQNKIPDVLEIFYQEYSKYSITEIEMISDYHFRFLHTTSLPVIILMAPKLALAQVYFENDQLVQGNHTINAIYAHTINYHKNADLAIVLFKISQLYKSIGYYEISLEYILKSFKIVDSYDCMFIAAAFHSIGDVFFHIKDYEKAEKYYIIARNNSCREYFNWQTTVINNNLGLIKLKQNNPLEALKIFENNLVSYKKRNKGIVTKVDSAYEAYINHLIGTTYNEINKPNDAIPYLLKTLEPMKVIGMNSEIAESYLELGKSNLQLKNLNEALLYSNEANKYIQKYKLNSHEFRYLKNLMDLYKQKKQIDSLSKYTDLYIKKINDSKTKLLSRTLNQAYASIEIDNINQSFLEEKNKVVVEKKIRKQMVAIIVMLFVFVIFILYFVLSTANKNKRLVEKNSIINQQKEELTAQSNQLSINLHKLNELTNQKEAFNAMIAHDMRNPLSAILLQASTKYQDVDKEALLNATYQINNLIEDFIDLQKFEDGKLKLQRTNCNLNYLVSIALQKTQHLIESKHLKVVNCIDSRLFCFVDNKIIQRVFINIISNAVKHCNNNGTLKITTSSNNCFLDDASAAIQLSFLDNGTGISASNLSQIFNKYISYTAINSDSEIKSHGLGLSFCKWAVEAHYGKIEVVSEEGKGSEFRVFLPKGENNAQDTQRMDQIKTLFVFSVEEKKLLFPFISELKQAKIYKISLLLEVLNKIPSDTSEKINKWKKQLEMAAYTNNQELFNQLLKCID